MCNKLGIRKIVPLWLEYRVLIVGNAWNNKCMCVLCGQWKPYMGLNLYKFSSLSQIVVAFKLYLENKNELNVIITQTPYLVEGSHDSWPQEKFWTVSDKTLPYCNNWVLFWVVKYIHIILPWMCTVIQVSTVHFHYFADLILVYYSLLIWVPESMPIVCSQ